MILVCEMNVVRFWLVAFYSFMVWSKQWIMIINIGILRKFKEP